MTVQSTSGVSYTKVDQSYFEKRGLRRYAGVWSLWALGVGAVISGHFSGWNLGLTNGWGSMLVATIIIAVMYLGLTFSLAEMSPALPHTPPRCSMHLRAVTAFRRTSADGFPSFAATPPIPQAS